jgi:hypothetical protein
MKNPPVRAGFSWLLIFSVDIRRVDQASLFFLRRLSQPMPTMPVPNSEIVNGSPLRRHAHQCRLGLDDAGVTN